MDNNGASHIISIQELFRGIHKGFDESKKIKMIRLKDREGKIMIGNVEQSLDLIYIYKFHRNQFEEYFKEETKPIFDDAEYVVAFIGEDGTDSRLVGVYENHGLNAAKSKKLSLNYYDLEPIQEFGHLFDRVVVDWGLHQQQWHQWWNNVKFVTSIDGFIDKSIPRFLSYEDVILRHDELKAIFNRKDSQWKEKLQSVNCIYAIIDNSNGKLYIGSTYGESGIWGRWQEYANSGHGDNIELKNLIDKDSKYANHFQWIILEVLPLKISSEKAIMRENFYKEKFLTRVFGYNRN